MKDYKVLKFLDLFKSLFKRLNIDYQSMRKILQVKLTLDSRRTSTVLQNSNTTDKNNFIKSLGMYLLLGIIMVPLVLFGDNYLFQMSLVFGIFMFLMITSLISDFSSVLLDIRDKDILLSRPINSRTLNTAKILHIFFYVFMISISLIGPSLIASIINKSFIFFIIFLFQIILIDLFLIVLTGLIYILILRFFDGEKLKDMINYVQIGLTIIITIGYQFIGRLFNFVDLENIEFSYKWWSYLLPPIWFSAPFELILKGNKENSIVIYSLIALIIPILSIIIYIKLIPVFESNLQKLNEASKPKVKKVNISDFIAKLVCKTREEQAFYKFSTNMIKKERQFKLRVYPSLGMGFILPLIMPLAFSIDDGLTGLQDSKMYFTIYFIFFAISAMPQFLKYSGDYKGAWIYKIIPIENTRNIYKGTIKSAFINLFTPLFIIVSIIFLFIFNFKIIPHIIITYLNMMVAIVIIFKLGRKDLPFSMDFGIRQEGRLIQMFLSMITILVLFILHYMFEKITYGIYIYLITLLIGNYLIWNHGFKIESN